MEDRLIAVREKMHEHGCSFPMLIDADGENAKSYNVYRLPHQIIIDKEGRIQFLGDVRWLKGVRQTVAQIERLLDDAFYVVQ